MAQAFANASPQIHAGIVVIDDHPAIGRLLKAALRTLTLNSERASIQQFCNVNEVLELCQDAAPALILLDRNIPPFTCFRQSVTQLRDVYGGPIVVLTGTLPSDLGEHVIDKEVSAFFHKDDLLSQDLFDTIQLFVRKNETGQ